MTELELQVYKKHYDELLEKQPCSYPKGICDSCGRVTPIYFEHGDAIYCPWCVLT